MKKLFSLIHLTVLVSSMNLSAQQKAIKDSVEGYFNEIETVLKENKDLWGLNLYAPILLVRPDTRERGDL